MIDLLFALAYWTVLLSAVVSLAVLALVVWLWVKDLWDGPSEAPPVAGVGGSPPPAPVVFLDDVTARRRPERTIA